MDDLKSLDQLHTITDEMLGGLHADERMRLNIQRAVSAQKAKPRTTRTKTFVPAVCCAAMVLACVGLVSLQPNRSMLMKNMPQTVQVNTIAAGAQENRSAGEMVAVLGDGATVRQAAPRGDNLFATGEGDIPLVAVHGGVYQMLRTPRSVNRSMLTDVVGTIATQEEQPSLASESAWQAGLSNVAQAGTPVYGLSSVADSTLVAAEVNGDMRVFQRVSYVGKGPGGLGLEDTFSVRGQVKEMTLSGVGTLSGAKANEVVAVLLDRAVLKSADASAKRQTLLVTLENGLKLQLGVSGDMLCGCGGWSCPEFFEAFEAAL